MNKPHWLKSREIVERVLIQGDLTLETPTSFGTGDFEGLVDIPLALDPLEGKALLTGASLAGALRSYLREREFGYGKKDSGSKNSLYLTLFGLQEDDESEQSFLIVHDSLSKVPQVELRDGVKINPKTRTAKDKHKFDYELIEAGTTFPIKMELLLPKDKKKGQMLVTALTICLQGLEKGEIALGYRKRRGFGCCKVGTWEVCRYDLTKPEGLINWLDKSKKSVQRENNIVSLFSVNKSLLVDKRSIFEMEATFSLENSLIIRSGSGDAGSPDVVHLRSNRNLEPSEDSPNGTSLYPNKENDPSPVLSGTSLAGALRARALRIAKTVGDEKKAITLVNDLFGPNISKESKDEAFASRVITSETEIIKPLDLVQQRIKIDRFTGSSFPAALFNEQPVFENKDTEIRMKIAIQKPKNAHIGILLLVLKDIWTGDLPIGGEASIGRGRLRGKKADITYKRSNLNTPQKWTIKKKCYGKLEILGDEVKLESFIRSFLAEIET